MEHLYAAVKRCSSKVAPLLLVFTVEGRFMQIASNANSEGGIANAYAYANQPAFSRFSLRPLRAIRAVAFPAEYSKDTV